MITVGGNHILRRVWSPNPPLIILFHGTQVVASAILLRLDFNSSQYEVSGIQTYTRYAVAGQALNHRRSFLGRRA